jgi:hypothetical protein
MNMEKLTPQNEDQEHMVQILLARMQNVPVECKGPHGWFILDSNCLYLDANYRIASKPTPLPITREMWAMINEMWKYAAMDEGGNVYLYSNRPSSTVSDGKWCSCGWSKIGCPLAISLDDINWKHSLTERPEDV